MLSKFRGGGFVFFGTLADFVVISVVALVLLRRLYQRAAGGSHLPALLAS